jgi:hypothetical protein
MATCPRCNGEGFRMVQEDHGGPLVKDSCYHCGETGKVSEEQLRSDKVQGLIAIIAGRLCYKAEQDCKSHPEGEDWAFEAAESGCSLEVYRYGRLSAFEMEVAEALSKLDEKHPEIVEVLLELTDAKPEQPVMQLAPEAKKEPEARFDETNDREPPGDLPF